MKTLNTMESKIISLVQETADHVNIAVSDMYDIYHTITGSMVFAQLLYHRIYTDYAITASESYAIIDNDTKMIETVLINFNDRFWNCNGMYDMETLDKSKKVYPISKVMKYSINQSLFNLEIQDVNLQTIMAKYADDIARTIYINQENIMIYDINNNTWEEDIDIDGYPDVDCHIMTSEEYTFRFIAISNEYNTYDDNYDNSKPYSENEVQLMIYPYDIDKMKENNTFIESMGCYDDDNNCHYMKSIDIIFRDGSIKTTFEAKTLDKNRKIDTIFRNYENVRYIKVNFYDTELPYILWYENRFDEPGNLNKLMVIITKNDIGEQI